MVLAYYFSFQLIKIKVHSLNDLFFVGLIIILPWLMISNHIDSEKLYSFRKSFLIPKIQIVLNHLDYSILFSYLVLIYVLIISKFKVACQDYSSSLDELITSTRPINFRLKL